MGFIIFSALFFGYFIFALFFALCSESKERRQWLLRGAFSLMV